MKWMIDIFKYTFIDRKFQKEVKKRYYIKNSQFFYIDRSLLYAYFLKNPYKVSKRYLKKKQEKEIHTYGETPLFSYELIAKEGNIQENDTVLELGCGRGRGLFFLNSFFKCKVIGIERIPLFVNLAKQVIKKNNLNNISILCDDMVSMTLPKATVIYLYGTNLSNEEIKQLIYKLKVLSKGTRVISISYPLTHYDKKSFQIIKTFSVSFPWGKTEAYLQVIR